MLLKGKSHLMRKTVVLGVLFVGVVFADPGWLLKNSMLTLTYTGGTLPKAGVGVPWSTTSQKWALEARTMGGGTDSCWKALRLSLGSGITSNITLNATAKPSYYFVLSNDTGSGFIFSTGTLQGSTTGIGTERMRILSSNGDVGINTPTPGEKLEVAGNVKCDTVKCAVVKINGWTLRAPDYVFEKSYKLRSLNEVEKHIAAEKHLPGVPSALEMKKNGVDLSELNMTLLKKVEELTLYVIAQNKNIITQNKKIEALEKKVNERK